MDYTEFVKPELLLLIPVLYALGAWIKKSNVKDWKIPFILGGAGIGLSVLYLFSVTNFYCSKDTATLVFTAITQGILVTAAAVFFNQTIKQATVGRKEDDGLSVK